jgi:hypothetical protein
MSHYYEYEKIPVPRNRIFVLNDGMFVVQWEENRVQDLLTGRYYPYSESHFGNAITNYELKQLYNSGIVEDFDEELVYLSHNVNIGAHTPLRTYYLNTILPKSQMPQVRQALEDAQLLDRFSVRVQEIFVIIRGPSGMAFNNFDEADRAREALIEQVPDLLGDTVVAFVEINAVP